MSVSNKIKRLIKGAESLGIDAVVIVPGPNLRYLIGLEFIALERLIALVIPVSNSPLLIIPELERERVEKSGLIKLVDVVSYSDSENPYELLVSMLKKLNTLRIGVEGTIQYRIAGKLLAKGFKLSEVDHLLQELRIVKDDSELRIIESAVRIVEESIVEGYRNLKPGISERELSRIVRDRAEELGAEEAPYCIVQSGPNTALPHAVPSSRKVLEGDVVLFDVSIRFNGYFADLTRVYTVGRPKPEHIRIHEIVLRAQENALRAIKPGVKASVIDRAVREVISREGYGPHFIHRTGHGLGVEVHERPYISPLSDELLREGMVFTVEPGIYLPGRFGVRLEDDVVVTDKGYRNLARLSKSLEGP